MLQNFNFLVCVILISPALMFVSEGNAMERAKCYNWQGEAVADGERYVPNKDDPCMTCICDKGFRIMCKSVACSPPGNCALWEPIEGVCCEYKCIKQGVPGTPFNASNPDQDSGTVTDDESITNLGLRLVASTVTSFLVLALLLFMVHRLRQRRLLLAMRRFEAQARRQQLEETDSDQYIPETFLGIECPPYEDPPPPYSPPKPHPRILPGEAPPPYDEIDQNPLSPLNNNEINRIITEESSAPTPRQCSVVQNASNSNTDVSAQCVQASATPQLECRIENETVRRNQNPNDTVTRGVCVLPDFNGQMHSLVTNLNPAQQNRHVNTGSFLPHNGSVSPTSPTGEVPLLTPLGHRESREECSCDEDQTMLKRCYSYEHFNPQQACNLQESPLLRQNMPSSSQIPENVLNSIPHSQHVTMSSSLTEHSDPKKLIKQFHRFSSLPRQLRAPTDARLSNPNPLGELAETEQGIPLVDMRKIVGQETTVANDISEHSPVRPSLRTAADGSSRQDLLRATLQPLTLSDKVTPLCNNILVPNQGQASVQSSEARLRNLRLFNLAQSPTKQLDSPSSPVSPDGQLMKRSQSVTSEVSIFSICSETGELRIPKPTLQSLRNDSQYPDIPIRPQFLKQLANNVETCLGTNQRVTQMTGSGAHYQHESPREIIPNTQYTDDTRPMLESGNETQLCVGDVGGPIGASALIKSFNKLNSELKSKTEDTPKTNRYSTGSLPVSKSKKTRQNMEAGPSKTCDQKSSDHSVRKHESGRRKVSKPVGSIKQYGFIDNGACPQSNSSVKLDCLKGSSRTKESKSKRDSDIHRMKVLPEAPVHSNLSVLQPTPEISSVRNGRQVKPGVKRQLNYSDKNSPSPIRLKSRSKAAFNSGHKETDSGGTWNDLSKDSNCVPRRKNKSSSSRSKKRQSYPVSNIQTAESSGIVLSRPNIVGCVSDLTNETVPPMLETASVNADPTLLNGYVYKYNTDAPRENSNVYSKLRPTSLSSYV